MANKMVDLLSQLEALADANDEEFSLDKRERKRLYDAARKVMHRVESEQDTLQRIGLSPSVAKIAYNLKIFETLVESGPKKFEELASQTGINPDMLSRILKFCAAHGMIAEPGVGEYGACHMTRNLAQPGVRGGILVHRDLTNPAVLALPDFLVKTDYAIPTDHRHGPFQEGLNTSDAYFEYLKKRPALYKAFNEYMTVPRNESGDLGDFYDFSKLWGSHATEETPLFVDIGGGLGQQCISLRRSTNSIGRVILQDLPHVVEGVSIDGVEAMAYSFFDEQPIKGAKAYYMRAILHDHPDESCMKILTRIRDAMGPDSVILLDERVIPDRGAHWFAMNLDISMMVLLAARERSETQWGELLGKANLKIKTLNTYSPNSYSIIEVVKK